MHHIERTDASNSTFIRLVKLLDAELAERDGDDHAFYDQFNKIIEIKQAVVLYINGKPIGCGAIKKLDPQSMEIKRMYVLPDSRGKGLAGEILHALEQWAKELKYSRCVLETGKRQPEAINLYLKKGYNRIANYGQYAQIENSLCFQKLL